MISTFKQFAEVILPLPLGSTFTYGVPDALIDNLKIGSRVIVQFGQRKFHTAIVCSLLSQLPENFKADHLKSIEEILDSEPVVNRSQLQLWKWIADYYMCSIGDVYKAALPSGLRLESETYVEIAPEYADLITKNADLKPKQFAILNHLAHIDKRISLSQLSKSIESVSVTLAVKDLIERGLIIISEKLIERYRNVKEVYVELNARRGVPGENSRLFTLVKGAPKQERALLALIEMSDFMRPASVDIKDVTRKDLCERAGISHAVLAGMIKKGVIRSTEKIIGRFKYNGPTGGVLPILSPHQAAALREIHNAWNDKDVTLIHGVTSSGKTEVYIHLIDFTLRQGKQVLFLVPEIALTTQLTTRLQRVFGDKVVIYHSKFSDNERVDIWRSLLSDGSPKVVIGARSAVFLPFSCLGLVVVDEEHEASYKQQDPAPRYNGRDVATVLARLFGAKTLFGSATPSVETYHKALTGRFGLVSMTERFGGVRLPEIEIIDMLKARERKAVDGAFSFRLKSSVNEGIAHGDQAILFLNRRGYAPVAECRCCAYVPKCSDCDVALTYHKRINRLVCHYCGTEYEVPRLCPVCKEPTIEIRGYGTERIEEDIKNAFPHTRILRMDLDTTRAKSGYDSIIDEFSRGKADILVGTQMVTKGLDFGGVTTVGVVSADSMLNYPDFKASERAFNMIEQVAGRAGRRENRGQVIVQTRQPEHPVIKFISNHDYLGFYNFEIEQRQRYFYPPFSRLISIIIRHLDSRHLKDLSGALAVRLRQMFGDRVNGPEEPVVARVHRYFIHRILMKFETEASMVKAKEYLALAVAELRASGIEGAKSVLISFDVDPS